MVKDHFNLAAAAQKAKDWAEAGAFEEQLDSDRQSWGMIMWHHLHLGRIICPAGAQLQSNTPGTSATQIVGSSFIQQKISWPYLTFHIHYTSSSQKPPWEPSVRAGRLVLPPLLLCTRMFSVLLLLSASPGSLPLQENKSVYKLQTALCKPEPRAANCMFSQVSSASFPRHRALR